ncbi:helix-turn-helix domain-containing protein [Meiothermus taiwanensis]|uniref:helix-turn-helix domain-containing protein n=1 Tax=Meiothermus taiwanensis TaxID=172827 RepID=UPI0003F62DC1|nr:MAG: hypothetical protein KatS3mg071_2582 [Meiothermus sp.]
MVYRYRIRDLAEENGISLYRLAKMSGLLPATVYAIARGETQPTPETLRRLHQTLETLLNREVSLDELIEVKRTT